MRKLKDNTACVLRPSYSLLKTIVLLIEIQRRNVLCFNPLPRISF